MLITIVSQPTEVAVVVHAVAIITDIFTTPTQPQLNSKVGFDIKRTLHHHHPTNSMSAISHPLLTRF